MNVTRRDVLAGTAAVGLALVPGLGRAARAPVIGGPAFGTYWRLTLGGDGDPAALRPAIAGVIGEIDRLMSPFRLDSEITRFNLGRTRGWFPLSPPTRQVVAAALGVSAATAGAFDPTVGPAVARFGFGPIAGGGGGPAGLALGAGGLRKADPRLTFDPCGIAKGYALDRIAAALDRAGVADYLIECGGEALARGRHGSGRRWQIGVEAPGAARLAFQCVIALDGEAVASSGDSINGYTIAGRRYSHIIDPASGEPVDNGIASVSVIARRAAEADALATALMVMGADKGTAFADRHGLAVLFIMHGPGGGREIATAPFRARIVA